MDSLAPKQTRSLQGYPGEAQTVSTQFEELQIQIDVLVQKNHIHEMENLVKNYLDAYLSKGITFEEFLPRLDTVLDWTLLLYLETADAIESDQKVQVIQQIANGIASVIFRTDYDLSKDGDFSKSHEILRYMFHRTEHACQPEDSFRSCVKSRADRGYKVAQRAVEMWSLEAEDLKKAADQGYPPAREALSTELVAHPIHYENPTSKVTSDYLEDSATAVSTEFKKLQIQIDNLLKINTLVKMNQIDEVEKLVKNYLDSYRSRGITPTAFLQRLDEVLDSTLHLYLIDLKKGETTDAIKSDPKVQVIQKIALGIASSIFRTNYDVSDNTEIFQYMHHRLAPYPYIFEPVFMKCVQKRANRGSRVAQFAVGISASKDGDIKKAADYLAKSAAQGYQPAIEAQSSCEAVVEKESQNYAIYPLRSAYVQNTAKVVPVQIEELEKEIQTLVKSHQVSHGGVRSMVKEYCDNHFLNCANPKEFKPRLDEVLDLTLHLYLTDLKNGKTTNAMQSDPNVHVAQQIALGITDSISKTIYYAPNATEIAHYIKHENNADEEYEILFRGRIARGADGGRKVAQFVLGMWGLECVSPHLNAGLGENCSRIDPSQSGLTEWRNQYNKHYKEPTYYFTASAKQGYQPAIEAQSTTSRYGLAQIYEKYFSSAEAILGLYAQAAAEGDASAISRRDDICLSQINMAISDYHEIKKDLSEYLKSRELRDENIFSCYSKFKEHLSKSLESLKRIYELSRLGPPWPGLSQIKELYVQLLTLSADEGYGWDAAYILSAGYSAGGVFGFSAEKALDYSKKALEHFKNSGRKLDDYGSYVGGRTIIFDDWIVLEKKAAKEEVFAVLATSAATAAFRLAQKLMPYNPVKAEQYYNRHHELSQKYAENNRGIFRIPN